MDITTTETSVSQKKAWLKACSIHDIPKDGGACVLLKGRQIAVFNFYSRNEWYATQNLCPHKMQMAISRGMIGDQAGEPKVACPFHKKTFSLKTGECLNADECSIETYPVKLQDEMVYIEI